LSIFGRHVVSLSLCRLRLRQRIHKLLKARILFRRGPLTLAFRVTLDPLVRNP
jgi:hypothetical protein